MDNTRAIDKAHVVNLQSKVLPFFIKELIEEQKDEDILESNLPSLLEPVFKYNEIGFNSDHEDC